MYSQCWVPREPDGNDRTTVERVDPLLGSVLDRRYRIDFRIAAGGFGAIYRATHVKSGTELALKVLHPQLTTDAGVVARFRREGATLTTLRSPHTVTAYELGEAADGTLYMVMELLRGENLYEAYRAHGRFEWKRMMRIARSVCDSLAEAHALGIVHRDLKPTNIHLEPKDGDPDFVKVLDFGIAKILRDSDFDSSDLTNAGQMIGTLDYMAPEQMVGGTLTGQCDIYTLGIVMYEMITGARPFAEAATASAALAAILKTTPPPVSSRAPVPREVDRIIARCLERDLAKRYPTVAALADDLDAIVPGEGTQTSVTAPPRMSAEMDVVSGESTVVNMPAPVAPREDDFDELTVRADARTKLPFDADRTVERDPSPRGRSPSAPPRRVVSDPTAPADGPTESAPSHARDAIDTPPFVRPPGTPPAVLPTASPFKSTLASAAPPSPPGDVYTHGFAPPQYPYGSPTPATPPPPYARAPSSPPFPPAPGFGPPAGYGRPPTGTNLPAFDMAAISARDAAMRRLVWIIVLVAGAIAGIAIATQL